MNCYNVIAFIAYCYRFLQQQHIACNCLAFIFPWVFQQKLVQQAFWVSRRFARSYTFCEHKIAIRADRFTPIFSTYDRHERVAPSTYFATRFVRKSKKKPVTTRLNHTGKVRDTSQRSASGPVDDARNSPNLSASVSSRGGRDSGTE